MPPRHKKNIGRFTDQIPGTQARWHQCIVTKIRDADPIFRKLVHIKQITPCVLRDTKDVVGSLCRTALPVSYRVTDGKTLREALLNHVVHSENVRHFGATQRLLCIIGFVNQIRANEGSKRSTQG